MLPRTQSGVLESDGATLRSYNVTGANAAAWAPGRVSVNGGEGGLISGAATVTWRKRDGAVPAVMFYSDDIGQASSSTYKVTVKSGSTVVKTVSGISGESWAFDD